MPILKSAKKQLRQSKVHRKRNFVVRAKVKDVIKNMIILAKEGKIEEATKLLPSAYKTIDTACKKNLFHKKQAARKKSHLAKMIAGAVKK